MRSSKGWIASALLLPALLLIALYWPSLDHEFVWTDQGEIEHGILILPHGRLLEAFTQPMHPDLNSLAPGAAQPYYRPLQVVVATSIDAEFGRRPRAFRSATIGLGALSIALFAALAWQLFRDPLPVMIAAALSAAHPVGIEMFVWIAGLSGSLAHVFVLLSLLTAVVALDLPGRSARAAWLGISLAAFCLGLLSKESAVVTPALLVAIAISQRRFGGSEPAQRNALLGVLAAQVAIAALFALVWRPHVLEGTLAGAPLIAGELSTQLCTAIASWPSRLAWLFAPTFSTTSDVVPIARSIFDPRVSIGLLCAIGSLGAWWRLLRGGRPIAALGLAWVWIAFLPTSGLIPLTHMRAERYVALSLFGAALLVADLLPAIGRAFAPRAARAVAAGLAALMLIGLAGRTAARIPEWHSNLVLFGADTSRDPLFREGYYILASTLADRGRFEEAYEQLAQLRAIAPRFAGSSSFLRTEDAFLLQCRVNRVLGRSAETLPLFMGELRADSDGVNSLPALYLCGAQTLADVGRFDESLAIATQVGARDPNIVDPLAALVAIRARIELGQFDEAERAIAAIPVSALRGAAIDAELRQTKALLHERRSSLRH